MRLVEFRPRCCIGFDFTQAETFVLARWLLRRQSVVLDICRDSIELGSALNVQVWTASWGGFGSGRQ